MPNCRRLWLTRDMGGGYELWEGDEPPDYKPGCHPGHADECLWVKES